MSGGGVRFSVVVAARVGDGVVEAVEVLRGLGGWEGVEVLVVRGGCPSRQRNVGAGLAGGEVLYFLDDDSVVDVGNLERLVGVFGNGDVGAAGGPSLCPVGGSVWERAVGGVMGCWLGFGPSSARYRCVGRRGRWVSERELILCNLAVRVSDFRRVGGFDEGFFPNEENVLLGELGGLGRGLWYEPGLVVWRRPRGSVLGFGWMVFRYGRGRGEQVRCYGVGGAWLNFVPLLWVVFLVGLVGWGWLVGGVGWVGWLLLWVYGGVSVGWGCWFGWGLVGELGWVGGVLGGFFGWVGLVLGHVCYGLGLGWGLVWGGWLRRRRLRRRGKDDGDGDGVSVERFVLGGEGLE